MFHYPYRRASVRPSRVVPRLAKLCPMEASKLLTSRGVQVSGSSIVAEDPPLGNYTLLVNFIETR